MKHLNGNLLCAVDIETTGLVAGVHDIIEVAIIPLDHNLEPKTGFRIFDAMLQPLRPEKAEPSALRSNGISLKEAQERGVNPHRAAEYLEEWFEGLNLGPNKRIIPVAQNWAGIDNAFIKEWVGPLGMNYIFSHQVRDTRTAALFINDRAAWMGHRIPFPKTDLTYLANVLGIEHRGAHRAANDALVTSQVYQKLMTWIISGMGKMA